MVTNAVAVRVRDCVSSEWGKGIGGRDNATKRRKRADSTEAPWALPFRWIPCCPLYLSVGIARIGIKK